MVPQAERRNAQGLFVGREVVGGDSAVENFGLLVDGENLAFGELVEDLTHAQHDDLMRDDEHALVRIM